MLFVQFNEDLPESTLRAILGAIFGALFGAKMNSIESTPRNRLDQARLLTRRRLTLRVLWDLLMRPARRKDGHRERRRRAPDGLHRLGAVEAAEAAPAKDVDPDVDVWVVNNSF